MLGVDPDMWITIGDLVNKGDMRTWNSAFFIPGESMLTAKTLTSVIGNHETMDKSDENGPTTYYDYFSVPSHGYIDTDERIDPRGESYFAMVGRAINECRFEMDIYFCACQCLFNQLSWAVVGQPKGIYSAVVGETRIGG